ncbi:MAG: hypothetical protein ACOCWG_00285 [bacterium]
MSYFRKDIGLMKILDFAKKTQIAKHFINFNQFLNKTPEEVHLYQIERLRSLLSHVQNTVPYYQNREDYKIDTSKISSISVLKRLPIINREDIREHQHELISEFYSKKELVSSSSSGTTGIPIKYYTDKKGLSAGVASGYTLWGMAGWKFGQRNIHIWGNKTSIKRWNTLGSKCKNLLINQKNIASNLLDNFLNFDDIIDDIIKFNPKSIEGYTSTIYTLADFMKKNAIKIDSLKQVFTTAENLERYQKELIEDVLAPVSDLYGSGEVKGIAIRPAGENKYYIFDPHVILETTESGIPGMKDVLLTDLDNYGMPLLRYKIGDMIDEIMEPEENSRFPFRWFTKVYGRSSDVISLPNGMKFHPVNIFGGTLFRKFGGITRHKVIWNGSVLNFVFEANNFKKGHELKNALGELLQPYQIEFTTSFVDKIEPSKSGKYKYLEIDDKGVE